jgi:hypothetical protein
VISRDLHAVASPRAVSALIKQLSCSHDDQNVIKCLTRFASEIALHWDGVAPGSLSFGLIENVILTFSEVEPSSAQATRTAKSMLCFTLQNPEDFECSRFVNILPMVARINSLEASDLVRLLLAIIRGIWDAISHVPVAELTRALMPLLGA